MTHDTLYVTGDTIHVTYKMWGGAHFFENFSSLGLTVWEREYVGNIFIKDDHVSLNQSLH